MGSSYTTYIGKRGDSASGYLRFDTRSGGSTTEKMRIDAVGTLLVAHSNQRNNFNSAVSTEHAPIIQLEGTNQRRAISITAANQDGGILMLARQNGSVGANTVVSSGNQIGRVDFQASGGTNMEIAAQITAEVDGTPGDNDMPGRLLFKTTPDGASSATERFRIASNGFVSKTYKPVKEIFNTNQGSTSGVRFEITLPNTSRMFKISGTFSFSGNGTGNIYADYGDWSDGA